MSRSQIVGTLPLLRDGRIPAVLSEFELADDTVEFTLEVPLSGQLLSALTRSTSPLTRPDPSSPPDAVLRVSWASGPAVEVGLLLPARSQAFARAVVRYGQPPELPELDWVKCSIEGTRWRHRLRFQPLPADGDLTFRLSSRLLDLRNAVGVVSIASLRSRLI